jgi:hypothetical protein
MITSNRKKKGKKKVPVRNALYRREEAQNQDERSEKLARPQEQQN